MRHLHRKKYRIPSPGFTLGFVRRYQVDRLLKNFTVDLADLNGCYQPGIVEQNPGWEYDIFSCAADNWVSALGSYRACTVGLVNSMKMRGLDWCPKPMQTLCSIVQLTVVKFVRGEFA